MRDLDFLLGDARTDLPRPLARTNYGGLVPASARLGIGTHFDASSSDKGAGQWFQDPKFKLSYNDAITDSGNVWRLTPSIWNIAFHMGVCLTPPASSNVAYFGQCITANDGDVVTAPQFSRLAQRCAIITRFMREEAKHPLWQGDLLDVRLLETIIVGHQERAIFNKKDNPTLPHLWGKLGRKHDPIGNNPSKPVLSLNSLRAATVSFMGAPEHPCWRRWNTTLTGAIT